MKPIVIFGAGEFAEVACFYFARDAGRKVVAFTADDTTGNNSLSGIPIIPFNDVVRKFAPGNYDVFVAIGSSDLNRNRRDKCAYIKSLGFGLASYISSKATIWTEITGEHVFILEHNTIQPYSKIGNNVIVWSGNHIGHHAIIGDHCFITSQVVISGGTIVGEGSFLGVNATIRDHIQVGKYNVIGAGTVILKNTADEEVYACKTSSRHPRKSSELLKI